MLLLMEHPLGLYGSEFVAKSDGVLGRGTVYTLLERLVDKGFVREIEEPPTSSYQMARTRHVITAVGQKATRDFLSSMKLEPTGNWNLGGSYA